MGFILETQPNIDFMFIVITRKMMERKDSFSFICLLYLLE